MDQRGSTFFIEAASGKKTKSLLQETPGKNALKTLVFTICAMFVAFCVWYLCMRFQGKMLKKIEYISGAEYNIFRVFWCVFIYSIAVIEFNGRFSKRAAQIVNAENHAY